MELAPGPQIENILKIMTLFQYWKYTENYDIISIYDYYLVILIVY